MEYPLDEFLQQSLHLTIENFFGLMKNELLYANKFESIEDFERALRKYIDWFNNKRLKLRLKGMSPVQYRAHYYKELNN